MIYIANCVLENKALVGLCQGPGLCNVSSAVVELRESCTGSPDDGSECQQKRKVLKNCVQIHRYFLQTITKVDQIYN